MQGVLHQQGTPDAQMRYCKDSHIDDGAKAMIETPSSAYASANAHHRTILHSFQQQSTRQQRRKTVHETN
jgi:hypothetical protein